jgi:hypothetical protein
MKFTKKPVEIDAVQWFKMGDHPAVTNPTDIEKTEDQGWCRTLEGGHIVTPGDWIITGVKGEHYPCKPDIFALTYEPSSQAVAPAQSMPEGWKLERIDDECGIGIRVTRELNRSHVFWQDGWKGEKNRSEQAAYDVFNAMLSAAPQPKQEQSGTDTQAITGEDVYLAGYEHEGGRWAANEHQKLWNDWADRLTKRLKLKGSK